MPASTISDAALVAQLVNRSGSIHAAEALCVIGRKLIAVRDGISGLRDEPIETTTAELSKLATGEQLGAKIGALRSMVDELLALVAQ